MFANRYRSAQWCLGTNDRGGVAKNVVLQFFLILSYHLCHHHHKFICFTKTRHNLLFHSFSVQLLDYFSYKGQMLLAYEKLTCNLHHILVKNSGKGLPLFIITKCSRHILSGLNFLTTHKVVHGDVKMSNIMWNANSGRFQLVDFGLSFLLENQVSGTKLHFQLIV